MLVALELDVADLAATRFAVSPLAETQRAIPVLAKPGRASVNMPWLRWALAELDRRPLRMPLVWPLLVTERPYWPEFLCPAPADRSPTIEEELDRVRAAPAAAVRASLRRIFGPGSWPDYATDLLSRPHEVLAQIAAEFAEFHERLIAPHWSRMRSVLDADIAYRGAMLAAGGARSLFRGLHPDLSWSAGALTMRDAEAGLSDGGVELGPDGLVLVPSVFIWPQWSVGKATSTQTTLLYPARGAATVWESELGLADLGAVEALLGAPRARLLGALRSPATTSALALRFGITASAVSQHLAVLYRGGLVDRQRSGRAVLYQASELGLGLLDRTAGRS